MIGAITNTNPVLDGAVKLKGQGKVK